MKIDEIDKLISSLPDTLFEPVFLKEKKLIDDDIKRLQEIKSKITNEDDIDDINQQIERMKKGNKGELDVIRELGYSGIPMYVISDLYLECDGLEAQIDFLLITQDTIFEIECKNNYGDVKITENGEVHITYTTKGGEKSYKLDSPVAQANRHQQVIKKLRLNSKSQTSEKRKIDENFETRYKSVVVMADKKCSIDIREAPDYMKESVISIESMNMLLKNTIETNVLEKNMKNIVRFFLENDKIAPKRYLYKYEKMLKANKLIKEKVGKLQTKTLLCTECGREMLLRKLDNGEIFYGCSGFEEKACKYRIMLTEENKHLLPSYSCEECGADMVILDVKNGYYEGNKFYGCSEFPKCRNKKYLDFFVKPKPEKLVAQKFDCSKCGREMLLRKSSTGEVFYGCSGYEEKACKNRIKLSQENKDLLPKYKCDKCGENMVIATTKSGEKAYCCSSYPKCDNKKYLEFKPIPQKN